MRNTLTLFCCTTLILVGCVAGPAAAEVDFVINVLPASLLINVSDEFVTTEEDDTRLSLSSIYQMPNISAGIGFDIGDFYVDITGGAGLVVNDSFRSLMVQAQLAVMYSVSDSLRLGPHVGLISFQSPTWIEDTELEMSGTTGWLAGLEMGMGDRIMYVVSVDMITASFDMKPGADLTTETEQLKISGMAVQFGVRGEF